MTQDTLMKKEFKTEKIFCILLLVTYGIGGIYLLYTQAYVQLLTLFFCIGFTAVMYYLHINIPQLVDKGVYITLCGFVLFASFLGSCFRFYDIIPWYDDFLHIWSGVIFTQMGFVLVRYFWEGKVSKKSMVFIMLFTFIFTMASASIWEIFEFASDTLFGLNMQAGGLVDTCIDMIDALIGAVCTMPHIYRLTKGLNIQNN